MPCFIMIMPKVLISSSLLFHDESNLVGPGRQNPQGNKAKVISRTRLQQTSSHEVKKERSEGLATLC